MNGTPRNPSLSVCVITHRRPQGLRRLLEALKPQVEGYPGRSIAVVNDGSHDAAYESVIREFAGIVCYRSLSRNVGTAAARNEVALLADGDFLVFIDDDCLPPPFWLDWLAARLADHSELDVVAGITRPLLPEKPDFFARVQAIHGIFPNPDRHGDQLRFVTANLAIRRVFFWQLGGFRHRPGFPGAAEDTELSSRVSRSKGSRRLDLEWYVCHDVGDGFRVNLRRYWRYGYSNGWLDKFTASPSYHDNDRWYCQTGAKRLAHFIWCFRRRLAQARPHFPFLASALYSALLATLVLDVAHLEGLRAARRAAKSQ
jgi:glycosyltransferase involved in cell wall biosynthesis